METIIRNNFKQLVQIIKESTPPSKQYADYECVANNGCIANSILTVGRNGDFFGFTIKVNSMIKPLFTDHLIIKGMELICVEEYDSVIRLFDIKNEYLEYGYDTIYYTIYKWFQNCKINISLFNSIKFNFSCPDIITRLNINRHDTINIPLTIVNIGSNVVPTEWIGKSFENGSSLHQAIDTLEWRRGKPKVTYCCTYGMTKINNSNVNLTINLKQNDNETIYITLDCNMKAKFENYSKHKEYSHYIEYVNNIRLIILYNEMDHFVSDAKLKKYSVGLLSSILQKSIRHGSCSTDILVDTINKLARAKPYNLPEQQFLKVSGSRQLFWRLFITCIEDYKFYYDINYINLFDILTMALITNMEPNYIVNDNIIKKLCDLGTAICNDNDYYEWRNYKNNDTICYSNDNNIWQNIMFISHNFIPKMQGDNIMILKYFDLLKTYKPISITKNSNIIKCKKCSIGMTPKYTGVDIHCVPNMILKFQAISKKHYTTQEISSLIWELNSKYNNRKPNEHNNNMFEGIDIINIKKLQEHYYDKYINVFDIIKNNDNKISENNTIDINLSSYDKRILFLKIFGQKIIIPNKKYGDRLLEVVFSYQDYVNNNKPIQIKYINSDLYLMDEDYNNNIERVYDYLSTNYTSIKLDNCIPGYMWKDNMNTIQIGLNNKMPIVKYNNTIIVLDWFDGSKLVTKHNFKNYMIPNDINIMVISNLLHENDIYNLDSNIEARKSNTNYFDLKNFTINSINKILLKSILVKIGTSFDDIITISQVSRNGGRVDNSLDYNYEGKYWKILNLLTYCYNEAIFVSGDMSYKLNRNSYQYYTMLSDIIYITNSKNITKNIYDTNIKLQSKLWDHQEQTVNFILSNIIDGKRGFGDASNVGAGKTLTALATCLELYKYDKNNNNILVLLPSANLIDTWTTEIDKHFIGMNIIIQNSDGKIKGKYILDRLNIYITTMGRNRDHMIKNDWLFVVIDECLTVQNKEAKQTIAAWEQSICSKFGILLLSATFFRTRFDKLLYMLKMLNCMLPETKDYLDTILIDSIKVNLPINKRVWNENVFKENLDSDLLLRYNNINNTIQSNEKKYIELKKFIRDNVDYIKIFKKYIDNMKDSKLLIYASSKEEAENISKIKDVGLYPDITKRHVVVSYAVGTYGLNNLVTFNHILTRPPEPDKLPQMKGRLDRMGQKAGELNITFVLIKNTIEEMEYMKLELCNKFYSNHIMPLSEFFKLKIN